MSTIFKNKILATLLTVVVGCPVQETVLTHAQRVDLIRILVLRIGTPGIDTLTDLTD